MDEIHLEDLRIDLIKPLLEADDAPDENGALVKQVVYTPTANAELADGRNIAFRHEKAFGPLRGDNASNSNWGRQCAFVSG